MISPLSISKSLILKELSEIVRAVERRGGPGLSPLVSQTATTETGGAQALATGWSPAPFLSRGGIHEWLGLAPSPAAPPSTSSRPRRPSPTHWTPPCGILIHLAHRAIARNGGSGGERERSGVILWIGRHIRPHAAAVGADDALLARSIFVDPPDVPSRLWAIDLALRSPAVAAVIADGSGLDMAALRRLQLAAEAGLRAGGGGIGLLARPPEEIGHISAAATRWLVHPAPTPARVPRWSIRLLRARGVLHVPDESAPFEVEWHRASCRVVVPAAVVHGPCQAASAPSLALRTA